MNNILVSLPKTRRFDLTRVILNRNFTVNNVNKAHPLAGEDNATFALIAASKEDVDFDFLSMLSLYRRLNIPTIVWDYNWNIYNTPSESKMRDANNYVFIASPLIRAYEESLFFPIDTFANDPLPTQDTLERRTNGIVFSNTKRVKRPDFEQEDSLLYRALNYTNVLYYNQPNDYDIAGYLPSVLSACVKSRVLCVFNISFVSDIPNIGLTRITHDSFDDFITLMYYDRRRYRQLLLAQHDFAVDMLSEGRFLRSLNEYVNIVSWSMAND